jgi:hypothetical protein
MSRVRRLRGFALVALVVLLLARDAPASGSGKETPIVVRVEDRFRWEDAGIGALAGIGISVATAGCVALVRLRGAGTSRRTKGEQHDQG